MDVAGLVCACVFAASSGGKPEAGTSGPDALPPKRDLFGTTSKKTGNRPASPRRVWGTVELSDGTRTEGWLSLAAGRPFEVYDLERKEWREFAIDELRAFRATVRKEELEREWRWKEYGKDEKVYTGRAYPKRWLDHDLLLRRQDEHRQDEQEEVQGDAERVERIACHVRGAALYLTTEPEKPPGEKEGGDTEADASKVSAKPRPEEAPRRLRFIIRQYERGALGQTLDDLVYVKRVVAHDRARRPKRTDGPPTEAIDPVRPAAGETKRPEPE